MKKEEWLHHYQAQQQSKLTVAAYCKKHKMSVSNWYARKIKFLGKSASAKKANFISPVVRKQEEWPILLRIGTDVEIEFPPTVKPITIANVAKSLGGV